MRAHPNNDKKKIMAGTKDSIVTIITKEKKIGRLYHKKTHEERISQGHVDLITYLRVAIHH